MTFPPKHLPPWGEEVATYHWWTHLTQSPTWKSRWWVDVIGSISSKRKSLWHSPKENKGKGQGWGCSSPRSLPHFEWTHTRHRTCTTYDVNHTRYLHTDHILELGNTQHFPSSVVPEQPQWAEVSGTYQGKRSPKAECHKTRRHSVWCRGCQRCSQVPSTSQGGRSIGKEARN